MSLHDFIKTNIETTSGPLTRETLDRAMRDALYAGLTEEQRLALDERVYGISFVKAGKRVPPWEVST